MMATAALYAMVAAVPFVGTSLLLPLVKRCCLSFGWLDHPGGRKQHRTPVPRLGGIAFFSSFATVVLAGVALAPALVTLPPVLALVPDIAGALAEVDFVLGGASEDDAIADAGGVVGIIGVVVDDVDGDVALLSGASLSTNDELPGGVLPGVVLAG